MIRFKALAFFFVFLCLSIFIFPMNAQYVLTDDDVEVNAEGVLLSCSKTFTENERHVIIPDELDGVSVKVIREEPGNSLFNSQIDTLVLPSTLEVIGGDAFSYTGLIHVDFSACTELTKIDYRAFMQNSIAELDLSSCTKLEKISWAVFLRNEISTLDLTACTSLTEIGFHAFSHNNLTSVDLPSSIVSLDYACFNNNQITSFNGKYSDGIIYALTEDGTVDSTYILSYGGGETIIDFLPDTIRIIGEGAFMSMDITSIDLSYLKSLTILGKRAFQTNKLSAVDLSECSSLIEIGSDAFNNNQFTRYTLPYEPTIPGHAFDGWYYAVGTEIEKADGKYTSNNNRLGCYAKQVELPKIVTIIVEYEDQPVEAASVTLGEYGMQVTTSDGTVIFDSVYAGEIEYTIDADGYLSTTDTLTVEQEDITFHIGLITPEDTTEKLKTVTLHVKSGENAIVGADVSFGDYGKKTTNSSGEVIFSDVYSGSVSYLVQAEGYKDNRGSITVEDEDINGNIELEPITTNLKESPLRTVRIWPVPVTNQLNLYSAFGLVKVEIYTPGGQLVLSECIHNTHAVINGDRLKTGMYIVKIKDGNDQIAKYNIVKY